MRAPYRNHSITVDVECRHSTPVGFGTSARLLLPQPRQVIRVRSPARAAPLPSGRLDSLSGATNCWLACCGHVVGSSPLLLAGKYPEATPARQFTTATDRHLPHRTIAIAARNRSSRSVDAYEATLNNDRSK
jgi:hypothetical protein